MVTSVFTLISFSVSWSVASKKPLHEQCVTTRSFPVRRGGTSFVLAPAAEVVRAVVSADSDVVGAVYADGGVWLLNRSRSAIARAAEGVVAMEVGALHARRRRWPRRAARYSSGTASKTTRPSATRAKYDDTSTPACSPRTQRSAAWRSASWRRSE